MGVLDAPITVCDELHFTGRVIHTRGRRPSAPRFNYREGAAVPLGIENFYVQRAWKWLHSYHWHCTEPDMFHTSGGLILLDGPRGKMVGGVHFDYGWIHPLLRRQNLGAEMIAAYEVAFPEILRSYNRKLRERTYSPEGLAVMKATHRLLVERGAVAEGLTE